MRDAAGATSSATLTVTIHGANDAPVLAAQTGDQNTTVGSAFSLTLPAGTFTDVDSGDYIDLRCDCHRRRQHSPPGWRLTPTTRTFSGTPSSTGTVGVRVTATDVGGLTASETFNIAVTPTP